MVSQCSALGCPGFDGFEFLDYHSFKISVCHNAIMFNNVLFCLTMQRYGNTEYLSSRYFFVSI